MGNGVPSDKRRLSAVEALAREHPTQLMARLRAVWPHVQQALKAGHKLRLVHERLKWPEYQSATKSSLFYRSRIERRKKPAAQPASQTAAKVSQIVAEPDRPSDDRSPRAFDPLVNLRAQEQKRLGLAISVRSSRRKQALLTKRSPTDGVLSRSGIF
jgi:hypothetical protein